jgi:hypothetical protein
MLYMGVCVYPDLIPLYYHYSIRHPKCWRNLEGANHWDGVCLGSWWML